MAQILDIGPVGSQVSTTQTNIIPLIGNETWVSRITSYNPDAGDFFQNVYFEVTEYTEITFTTWATSKSVVFDVWFNDLLTRDQSAALANDEFGSGWREATHLPGIFILTGGTGVPGVATSVLAPGIYWYSFHVANSAIGLNLNLEIDVKAKPLATLFTAHSDTKDFNDLSPADFQAIALAVNKDAILYYAQPGNDTVFLPDTTVIAPNVSYKFTEVFHGGDDNDSITGGVQWDKINGEQGFDTLNGGVGQDTLWGGNDNDTLNGGRDNDKISGGGGDDTIDGGSENDTLYGLDFPQTINGVKKVETGENVILGGAGEDTAIYGKAAAVYEFHALSLGELWGASNSKKPFNKDLNFQIRIEHLSGSNSDTIGGDVEKIEFRGGPSVSTNDLRGKAVLLDVFGGLEKFFNLLGPDAAAAATAAQLGQLLIRASLTGGAGRDIFITVVESLVLVLEGAIGAKYIDSLPRDIKDKVNDGFGKIFETIRENVRNKADDLYDSASKFLDSQSPRSAVNVASLEDALTKIILDGIVDTYKSATVGVTTPFRPEIVIVADQESPLLIDPKTIKFSQDFGQRDNVITITLSAHQRALIDLGGGNDRFFTEHQTGTVLGGLGNDALKVVVPSSIIAAARAGVGQISGVSFFGGEGNDSLTGGTSDDFLSGGIGSDLLDGGDGSDTASYAEKTDPIAVTLNGSNQVNVVVDGIPEDSIVNIENLIGGSGNDSIFGDARANTFQGNGGQDRLVGGSGSDTANYEEKTDAVSVVLNGSNFVNVLVGGVVEDKIKEFENVVGGKGADSISGDVLANQLTGGEGDDVLAGFRGRDILDGGLGFDIAGYSEKTTSVVVSLAGDIDADVTVGGVAEDTVRNIEGIIGGSGDDAFTGDFGDNWFAGRDGKDTIVGGLGQDTVSYSDKTVGVSVTLSNNSTASVGGVAEDTLSGVENLIGGDGDDKFVGNGQNNQLDGGIGDDDLSGGVGDDLLIGGLGKDRLIGGHGIDTADYSTREDALSISLINGMMSVGGIAEDKLFEIEVVIGGKGDDTIDGNLQDSVFVGGAGKDSFHSNGGLDVVEYSYETRPTVLHIDQFGNSTANIGGVDEDTLFGIFRIVGGSGDDTITSAVNSLLDGGAGDDLLIGGDFGDTFKASAGHDTFDGGKGVSGNVDIVDFTRSTVGVIAALNALTAKAILGNIELEDVFIRIEQLEGGSGNDVFVGDARDNLLFGNAGDDRLIGGGGENVLVGGEGSDTADYSDRAVRIIADLLNSPNQVRVGGGVDQIFGIENITGGSGNDILKGDLEINTLTGGSGDDVIIGQVFADANNDAFTGDLYDGGEGNDTADYSVVGGTLEVVLRDGEDAQVIWQGHGVVERLRNIENFSGGLAADTITGNSSDNILEGNGADDRLMGGGGSDVLDGGTGIDTVDYSDRTSAVEIVLQGNLAATARVGGVAEDSLMGIECIVGGSAGDRLEGDANDNKFMGGDGSDILLGGAGHDALEGGEGIDTVDYSALAESLTITLNGELWSRVTIGQTLKDSLRDVENVLSGSGDDQISGGASSNFLDGGSGADTIDGSSGNDNIKGGVGDDILIGGSGKDRFQFDAVQDSGLTAATRDVIEDFTVDAEMTSDFNDRIDLSGLDAMAGTGGNQAFTFVSGAAFTGEGQIRAVQSGASTILQINTVGSSGVEMQIELSNVTVTSLQGVDFIL